MTNRLFAVAAAVALLAGVPAAYAAPPAPLSEVVVHAPVAAGHAGTEVKHEAVKYGDLDLSSSEGAKSLLTRLRGASRHVCQPAPDRKDVKGMTDYRTCRRAAITTAVQDINNPHLTEAFKLAQK
jgi:UrcA family protein